MPVRRRTGYASPLISATVALLLALGSQIAPADAAAQPSLPVAVTIDRLDPGPPVPQEFLGLSFEAAALDQIAQYANRGDLVKLLRSLGPGILRFGGITADENVAWTDAVTPRPPWASRTIDAAQLHAHRRARPPQRLEGAADGRDGPLRTGGRGARGRGRAPRARADLAAVEIGNEPDAYGKHGFRELPWIAQGYEEEVSEYREAIGALTPGVPIAGPDVSGSGIFIEWGEEEALSQRPALLTGHHYPLGCAQKPAAHDRIAAQRPTRGRESRLAGHLHESGAQPARPAADRRDELGLLRRSAAGSATRSPRRCGRPATSRR